MIKVISATPTHITCFSSLNFDSFIVNVDSDIYTKLRLYLEDPSEVLERQIIDMYNIEQKLKNQKEEEERKLKEAEEQFEKRSHHLRQKLNSNYEITLKADILYVNKVGSLVYMPELLIEVIIEEENYEKYLKFWDRCLDNYKHVRQRIFDWIQKKDLYITEEGYIVGYRNANKIWDSSKCYHVDFDVKLSDNVYVDQNLSVNGIREGEFRLLGSASKNYYTHAHHTSFEDRLFFSLLEPYREKKADINPKNECSFGLSCSPFN